MTNLKASLKLAAFALLTLIVIPIQSLILLIHRGPHAYIVPRLWHKGVCFILGIKVQIKGEISDKSQTLYMGNHISYLDISAIGSILKRSSFVAKKDVAGWPVFGFLSTLQQTAFISRSREDAKNVAQSLDAMLDEGKSLIIFPEGTSTDGVEVLPFKSSLFSLAFRENLENLMVQPMTIAVLESDGKKPETQDERDLYAWHINMDTELPDHLWRFAKSNGAVLQLTFHPAYAVKDFENRKTLAKACHDTVSKGLELSNAA